MGTTPSEHLAHRQVFENFHSKLLDSAAPIWPPEVLNNETRYHALLKKFILEQYNDRNYGDSDEPICTLFVYAWGFRANVPGQPAAGLFPNDIGEWYESETVPNVHYLGWHMHKFDFERNSGGFLSGFRYDAPRGVRVCSRDSPLSMWATV